MSITFQNYMRFVLPIFTHTRVGVRPIPFSVSNRGRVRIVPYLPRPSCVTTAVAVGRS